MFGAHKAAKRFSLLLLEEGEDYVEDWVCEARWPPNVSGNWQGLPKLQGRMRLCSKSLFFEPDDARIPIVRHATVTTSLHSNHAPGTPPMHADTVHQSWPLLYSPASIPLLLAWLMLTAASSAPCAPPGGPMCIAT